MKREGKKIARRRQYFIKKSFQTRFLIGFVALIVIEALLIGALFLFTSSATVTTGYSGSRFVIDRTSSFFLVNFVFTSVVIGLALAITGALIFIFLSHRIAGPLFRFEDALRDISRGNLAGRISLRKADQLTGLQDSLNTTLDSLDSKLGGIKKDLDEASDLASRHDAQRHAQNIKDAIAKAQEKFSFFKTS
ncbi:methyl-accepting chemotaxis protein [Omnitrophica bacterium]|nr:methyl-accepting chemotaxis protein [Candidatus Omnitrophota bacterium]